MLQADVEIPPVYEKRNVLIARFSVNKENQEQARLLVK